MTCNLKIKYCWILCYALLLVHVLVFLLKLVQVLLSHLLGVLLSSELVQNGLLPVLLEFYRENAHYSLYLLTVFLVFYSAFIYMNKDVLTPFSDFGTENEMSEPLNLDELIDKVSKCIGNNWKQLGRKLSVFSETEIDAIEYENRQLGEQIYQLFYQWRRHVGNSATMETLIKAIAEADLPKEKVEALKREGIFHDSSEAWTSLQVLHSSPLKFPLPEHRLRFLVEQSQFQSEDFPWNGILFSSTVPNMRIGVCTAKGHVSLPANTELISPLYYFTFAGKKTLSSDLFVEFQHSACIMKNSQCDRLQFVVAKLPQSSPSYQLRPYTHKEYFNFFSSSGSIILPGLSPHHGYLIGMVKPWTRFWVLASSNLRSKYYLRAVVRSFSESEYEVNIVVVKSLQPYIQMIDKKYPPERFSPCGETELSLHEHSPRPFYESGLTFYSPFLKEWKISFTTSSAISRAKLENLESYSHSSHLPHVSLIFTRVTSVDAPQHPLSGLNCKLRVSGTALPYSCPTLSLRVAS